MEKLRLLDLFAGIGAVPKALSNLGIDYEIVDAVEIDKYAIKSYNAIHNTNFETQDITTWNKDIEVDIISHGSPCTDFSIVGKQLGGDYGSGTRSSLMYETIRIVDKLKPKYVIWENVKNLLSKKHRHNFDNYINIMEELGYTSYYKVLNAKDYGIPQNRERVYTISIRNDINKEFEFPVGFPLEKTVYDLLDNDIASNLYLSDVALTYALDLNDQQVGTKWEGSTSKGSVNKPIAMTIGCRSAACQRAGITNFILDGVYEEVKVKTLKERIRNGERPVIRKLSPCECYKLMGFDENDYKKAKEVNSNTQLYKQAGNSIVVNVLEYIFKELLK